MTGKEYMHEIRQVRRKIKLLQEQIDRDRALAEGVKGISYDKDPVQTSPVQDRMTDIIAKIIETTDDLKEEIYRLQLMEEECVGLLSQLNDEHERALSLHYLDGKSWAKVAEALDYERTAIYDLKDRALEELSKIIESSDTFRHFPTN